MKKTLVLAMALVAAAQAGVAGAQAGVASAPAGMATAQAGVAAQAGTVAAQAGMAAAQAGVAAQAGPVAGQAGVAAAQAGVAEQAGMAADSISVFGHDWTVPIKGDWKVVKDGDGETLELLVPRPSTQPRRPSQYALAQTEDFIKVTVEAEVKKEPLAARNRGTSLIFVYAWKDENHFNYVHLSVDTGQQQPVHNGVFHVYGGDRVRISSTDGPAALTSENWHKVKLVYDGTKGRVDVWVDGVALPSLQAVDLSLGAGKVGIGSFFDMGQFRNVRITGEPSE